MVILAKNEQNLQFFCLKDPDPVKITDPDPSSPKITDPTGSGSGSGSATLIESGSGKVETC